MATTTEILTPMASKRMMGGSSSSSFYYQCRRPTPLSIPCWPFNKRAHKRHSSSSTSLFDSSVLRGEILETNSLPSSPLPFVSLDAGKKIFWEDSDCGDNVVCLLSSSVSSGYSSASSSSSSSSSESSSSSSTSSAEFCPSCLSFQEDFHLKGRQSVSIPFELSTEHVDDANHTKDSQPPITNNNNAISPISRTISSKAPTVPESLELRILRTSPLTDVPSSSKPVSDDGGNASPPGNDDPTSKKLTSVPVSSKRSSSESSTSSSSGITSTDEPRRRVKDQDGFIRRAACLCVNEDESKVILISSKNEGGGWLVPGGGLEPDEAESDAAVREAWEEAGITGTVKRSLGVFQSEDESTHKKKRTAVYVLTVRETHSIFPEARLGRVREWFSIEAAISHLTRCKPHQIAYLQAL